MRKSIQIRVTPNMYSLIKAIKLLMSNDRGAECSMIDASEKAYELFKEFAAWDTQGDRILAEFSKIKSDKKVT